MGSELVQADSGATDSSEKVTVPKEQANERRGEIILGAIYDDVDARLNPNSEECWCCGGDGYTFDCIDGCCEDADIGCEDCSCECVECVLFAGKRSKAIREAVIQSGDIDVAKAWIKEQGRWHDGITDDEIREEMSKASQRLSLAPDSSLTFSNEAVSDQVSLNQTSLNPSE